MLQLPVPKGIITHNCYQCHHEFVVSLIDSVAFCSQECKNLYNGVTEHRTHEQLDTDTKKERSRLEIKRRWKQLNGEQIGKLLTAYFKEYHKEEPLKSQPDTPLDAAVRTFNNGLF